MDAVIAAVLNMAAALIELAAVIVPLLKEKRPRHRRRKR